MVESSYEEMRRRRIEDNKARLRVRPHTANLTLSRAVNSHLDSTRQNCTALTRPFVVMLVAGTGRAANVGIDERDQGEE